MDTVQKLRGQLIELMQENFEVPALTKMDNQAALSAAEHATPESAETIALKLDGQITSMHAFRSMGGMQAQQSGPSIGDLSCLNPLPPVPSMKMDFSSSIGGDMRGNAGPMTAGFPPPGMSGMAPPMSMMAGSRIQGGVSDVKMMHTLGMPGPGMQGGIAGVKEMHTLGMPGQNPMGSFPGNNPSGWMDQASKIQHQFQRPPMFPNASVAGESINRRLQALQQAHTGVNGINMNDPTAILSNSSSGFNSIRSNTDGSLKLDTLNDAAFLGPPGNFMMPMEKMNLDPQLSHSLDTTKLGSLSGTRTPSTSDERPPLDLVMNSLSLSQGSLTHNSGMHGQNSLSLSQGSLIHNSSLPGQQPSLDVMMNLPSSQQPLSTDHLTADQAVSGALIHVNNLLVQKDSRMQMPGLYNPNSVPRTLPHALRPPQGPPVPPINQQALLMPEFPRSPSSGSSSLLPPPPMFDMTRKQSTHLQSGLSSTRSIGGTDSDSRDDSAAQLLRHDSLKSRNISKMLPGYAIQPSKDNRSDHDMLRKILQMQPDRANTSQAGPPPKRSSAQQEKQRRGPIPVRPPSSGSSSSLDSVSAATGGAQDLQHILRHGALSTEISNKQRLVGVAPINRKIRKRKVTSAHDDTIPIVPGPSIEELSSSSAIMQATSFQKEKNSDNTWNSRTLATGPSKAAQQLTSLGRRPGGTRRAVPMSKLNFQRPTTTAILPVIEAPPEPIKKYALSDAIPPKIEEKSESVPIAEVSTTIEKTEESTTIPSPKQSSPPISHRTSRSPSPQGSSVSCSTPSYYRKKKKKKKKERDSARKEKNWKNNEWSDDKSWSHDSWKGWDEVGWWESRWNDKWNHDWYTAWKEWSNDWSNSSEWTKEWSSNQWTTESTEKSTETPTPALQPPPIGSITIPPHHGRCPHHGEHDTRLTELLSARSRGYLAGRSSSISDLYDDRRRPRSLLRRLALTAADDDLTNDRFSAEAEEREVLRKYLNKKRSSSRRLRRLREEDEDIDSPTAMTVFSRYPHRSDYSPKGPRTTVTEPSPRRMSPSRRSPRRLSPRTQRLRSWDVDRHREDPVRYPEQIGGRELSYDRMMGSYKGSQWSPWDEQWGSMYAWKEPWLQYNTWAPDLWSTWNEWSEESKKKKKRKKSSSSSERSSSYSEESSSDESDDNRHKRKKGRERDIIRNLQEESTRRKEEHLLLQQQLLRTQAAHLKTKEAMEDLRYHTDSRVDQALLKAVPDNRPKARRIQDLMNNMSQGPEIQKLQTQVRKLQLALSKQMSGESDDLQPWVNVFADS